MLMVKGFSALGAAVIVLVLVGAALFVYPYMPKNPPKADDTGSTQQGIQQVVAANNRFAFELYSNLSKSENGNIFFSPYSIFAALGMTYEGARGQTAEEMKAVFHFPEPSALRPNFAAIYNKINGASSEYEMRTGNALWVQYDYPILADYKSNVERYYGGKAAALDFIKETEKSRQTINSFIEEQTNGKIKDLIPPGALNALTRLVLTNAIYFKGTWKWEFNKSETSEGDFKTPQGAVKVQMMHMEPEEAKFNYADLEKLQILELPYKGDEVSMLILLPKQGERYDYRTGKMIEYNYSLEDIELTPEKLNEYKSQMQETKLDSIVMPKFEVENKYFMKNTLKDMGMPTAFTGAADFSGMNGAGGLEISEVIHQSYVKVDEEGTEAAAATAVIMKITAVRQTTDFIADHPFIFIIQEKETGAILFMGRIVDPR
jgi:serine protease inhibitor